MYQPSSIVSFFAGASKGPFRDSIHRDGDQRAAAEAATQYEAVPKLALFAAAFR